ncbi:MAG: T9SS type A sorting domain-containing protein [Saprospiraceae bacterium]|nr:T9SS type A sorting domain-containing protein [Saprospiraceae bacterium]MDW8483070.1 hypothetical protein [Saprospiraceae bacterium]
MEKRYLFFWVLLALAVEAAAQRHDRHWVLGYAEFPGLAGHGQARIVFDDTARAEAQPLAFNVESTMAAMSSAAGELLFYTNGCAVADRQHQVMPNGAGLNPGPLHDQVCARKGYIVPQGAVALPDPGDTNRYYLLHLGAAYEPVRKLRLGPLYATVVDMRLRGGLGDVVEKNRVLVSGDLGHFAVVRHGNGRDWWVLVPQYGNAVWHVLLLTPRGIEAAVPQGVGVLRSPCEKHLGMAVSLQGDRIANWGDCKVSVWSFDRCSGWLGAPLELSVPGGHWAPGGGVVFSPSGRYLYATSQVVLWRADLASADKPAFDTIRAAYNPWGPALYEVPGATFGYLAYGPDGVVYGAQPSRAQHLQVLRALERRPFMQVDVRLRGLALPVWSVRTLPYSVNYRLYDLAGSLCDTLGIDGPLSAPEALAGGGGVGLRVWPNPLAGEQLWVQVSEAEGGGASVLMLSDAAGRLLLSQPVEQGQGTLALPVGHLPAGLYLLTYRAPSGAVAVQKVVVP